VTLHYRTYGSPNNPTVIFLHGFMGSSLDWEPTVQLLSDEYHCVCVDLPGHGMSVVRDTYSFENVLMSMLNLLEELHVQQFALVGYSMGARVGLYLAQHLRDRVVALVIESGTPGISDESERAERLEKDRALAERLEHEPFSAFLYEWYEQPIFATLQARPALLQELIDSREANDPFELAAAMRGLSVGRQIDLWPVIPELPFPILAISGGLDPKYTKISEQMPGAGRVVITETGHNVHLENPTAYIKALSQFLSDYVKG
jgi:2-succinyl-6-hydroxy-2,4-cyclohexadiene-1-carboxylate synthase